MTRDQCVQQIPEGSQKLIQLTLDGGNAKEEHILECMGRTYAGPLCQEGGKQARALLAGDAWEFAE